MGSLEQTLAGTKVLVACSKPLRAVDLRVCDMHMVCLDLEGVLFLRSGSISLRKPV